MFFKALVCFCAFISSGTAGYGAGGASSYGGAASSYVGGASSYVGGASSYGSAPAGGMSYDGAGYSYNSRASSGLSGNPAYSNNQQTGGYSQRGQSPYAGRKTVGVKTAYVGTKTGYHKKPSDYVMISNSIKECEAPRVMNAQSSCRGSSDGQFSCSIECYAGFEFPFGNSIRHATCENGVLKTQEPYDIKTPCKPVCRPACENGGICIAPDQCYCGDDRFTGTQCQHERKPCLGHADMPNNSQRNCTSDYCIVTCLPRHHYPDGSTVANVFCRGGEWVPDRSDWKVVPHCQPSCEPSCQNGGRCLTVDTCLCPNGYSGLQCQYLTESCDISKLGFYGEVQCRDEAESRDCELGCPAPLVFSFPPAPSYTCLYSAGVFTPSPVPVCRLDTDTAPELDRSHTNDVSDGEDFSQKENWNQVEELPPQVEELPPQVEELPPQVEELPPQVEELPPQVEEAVDTPVVPTPGVCITWNGAHYKTFDGKIYSFQSSCAHILVRESQQQLFTVMVRPRSCDGPRCGPRIEVFVGQTNYTFTKDELGVKVLSEKGESRLPARLPDLEATLSADNVVVNLNNGKAAIKWDTRDLIQVSVTEALWNRTEGLCGVLDGRADTDLVDEARRPVGVDTLARHWRSVRPDEKCGNPSSEHPCSQSSAMHLMGNNICNSLLGSEKFQKCQKNVGQFASIMEACNWDYCSCMERRAPAPEQCSCASVAVFARQCVHDGVAELRDWRDEQTCPMSCPAGKVYKSCGPPAPPTCASPRYSVDESCVEGCFCPEGFLLHEGRCIEKTECSCQLGNKNFSPGAVISRDCNTCECTAGAWACTAEKCGARCSAVGDPHYTTFDGTKYDFMGKCTYKLLAGDDYDIQVENVACSGATSLLATFVENASNLRDLPSCTKTVTITYGAAVIKLDQDGIVLANGKKIDKLPATVQDIVIRPASSLFLMVELPNGIDVSWDTLTSVFVDVPASFRNKTKGLCGTFNDNQRDDFLTPEGDVEQAVAPFVNKWKTSEICADVSSITPDTCLLNLQNKPLALQHCSVLRGEVFKECHSLVDVTSFYAACVYDMCACKEDVARCLCPALGAYASECAKMGVQVHWRQHIDTCAIQCTGGQTYQVCADSCVRTCSDVSRHLFGPGGARACTPRCVEGCACPPGQALQVNEECAPVALCPCHHKGLEFRPGYKEVRDGKQGKVMCMCTLGKWKCRAATPEEILTYPRATDIQDSCREEEHLEFTTCEPTEPRTCKNMHLAESHTTAVCRPGCQCRAGYVLEGVSKRCVLPVDCPCHHGGQSYPDGHTRPEECNTCECKKGKWECTERECNGKCSVWGDSHFTTFDSLDFEFQGVCTYLMTQGHRHGQSFDIEIENEPCGTTGATCLRSFNIKVGDKTNNESITILRNKPLPDMSSLKRITQYEAGAFVFLVVGDDVLVQWDKATRLTVIVEPKWAGQLRGLCGNYNKDSRDDLTPAGGGLGVATLPFVDSWRLSAVCDSAVEVMDHCSERPHRRAWAALTCGALLRPPFSACHSEVPPQSHARRCERDACACDSGGDCECVCVALASYAQLCAARGVTFKWRSKELCPCQCDEETSYDPCVSACPEQTCENRLHYDTISKQCSEHACVEGCKLKKTCASGEVYTNSSLSACTPRAHCPCTLPDGRAVAEGAAVGGDACHACVCSRDQLVCRGQPCESPSTSTSSNLTTVQSTTAVPTTSEVTNIESTYPEITTELLTPESTTTESTTPIQSRVLERPVCRPGWSRWVDARAPASSDSKLKDKQPLPLPQVKDLTDSAGAGVCEHSMMKSVECRPARGAGQAACRLAGGGVLCRGRAGAIVDCPPLQIRVLCQCETVQVPESQTKPDCGNTSQQYHEHPRDCHKFYQCVPRGAGPELVEKTCGDSMWYNPKLMVCDWPSSVAPLRPACADAAIVQPIALIRESETNTTTTAQQTTAPALEPTTPVCGPREVWSNCAVECDKLCHAYSVQLNKQGLCLNGKACEGGCVEKGRRCGPGRVWRDSRRCVSPRDCTCLAENGDIIKPGGITTQGECSSCQCLDNKLSCDESPCANDTLTPTERTAAPAPSTTTPPDLIIVTTGTSPPPHCDTDRYKFVVWSGETPKAVLTASSQINDYFTPQNAILNVTKDGGSWIPADSDAGAYIQVELPRREPLYGVGVQGSPLYFKWVTKYHVLFGDDGQVFSYVLNDDGSHQVFDGPMDNRVVKMQRFSKPIEAKFVRIVPVSWHEGIALRLDLIGCEEETTPPPSTTTSTTTAAPATELTIVPVTAWENFATTARPAKLCTDPMGFSNGLPLENVQVSSEKDKVGNLDVNQPRAWRPSFNTPGEWIYFDFGGPRNVTGITVLGGKGGWMKTFNTMYAPQMKEGEKFKSWNFILNDDGSDKLFSANHDSDTPAVIVFSKPIRMRYLKMLPQSWHSNLEVRVEPIGCFEPYPHKSLTTSTPPPSPDCQLCPGLPVEAQQCHCPLGTFYNGSTCTLLKQCPCFVGHQPYVVGSVFMNERCEECTCKMGGVEVCHPVKCDSCPPEQVPHIRADCSCACRECAPGERACPTSAVCVSAKHWCDGVVDCGDDERSCPTPAPAVTTPSTSTTTPNPVEECPTVDCPPGYQRLLVHATGLFTPRTHAVDSTEDLSLLDLPPPPRRTSYSRYMGGAKGGKSLPAYRGGAKTKSSYTKTANFKFPKPPVPKQVVRNEKCPKYKCVPTPIRIKNQPCERPQCPANYKIHMEKEVKGSCPEFSCVPPKPREANCSVTGASLTTFDGSEHAHAACQHLLARDARDDKWSVIVQKNCTKLSDCDRELVIVEEDYELRMLSDLQVLYNNKLHTIDQAMKLGMNTDSFVLSKNGDVLFFVSKRHSFWITFNVRGDIKIGVKDLLSGRVDGLCGFYDGRADNDRRLPDGTAAVSAARFADAWTRQDLPPGVCQTKCPIKLQNTAYQLCNAITEKTLSSCGRVLDLNKWRVRCMEQACECVTRAGTGGGGGGGGGSGVEGCVCGALQSFVSECSAAAPALDLQGWRIDTQCPADCPAPLVHHDCYRRRCEPACGAGAGAGAGAECARAPGLCFTGCFCPEGKLRRGDECVAPHECRDCVCDGKGTPVKYTTFERADLPYSGNCTYIAARDKGSDHRYKFQVFVTNVPCASDPAAVCVEALHIVHDAHKIHIQKNNASTQLEVLVDGAPVYRSLTNTWLQVKILPTKDVSVVIPSVHFEVKTTFSNMDFSVLVASSTYSGRTEGLCGACGGGADDLRTSNGSVAADIDQYGLSWLADESALKGLDLTVEEFCRKQDESDCAPPPPEDDACLKIVDDPAFQECWALVEPFEYVQSCQRSACARGRRPGACSALERYAAECRRAGVCVHWRKPDFCPYTCEGGLEYNACGVGCAHTCDNFDDLTKHPEWCVEPRAEGCFCPHGKVLVNNTCIEPSKCFPCDAERLHYVGDEWQNDTCTKCSCFMSSTGRSVVSCVKQKCPAPPPCPADQVARAAPRAATECCERFTCGCKNRSECDPLPSDNEVPALEPGYVRVVNDSGCCPRADVVCDNTTCPEQPPCAPFYEALVKEQDKCCPSVECVLPADKCLVTLEWETRAEGGATRRAKPETLLKSVDDWWWDGACRRCACGARGVTCTDTACPDPRPPQDVLTELVPVPGECCPKERHVACTHDNTTFKVGETLPSAQDPCVSYECVLVSSEPYELEKRTARKECNKQCKPGWEYTEPAQNTCCGECRQTACAADGQLRPAGETWLSIDGCVTHTCVRSGVDMQVISEVKTCENVSEEMSRHFSVETTRPPGECCPVHTPVACRDNGTLYPEGSEWRTADPCVVARCSRTGGRLARTETREACAACGAGSEPRARAGQCCGECVPVACVDGDRLRPIKTTWQTSDNCTTMSCAAADGQAVLTRHSEACPDVSACAPRDRVTKGCCQHCKPAALAQTTCALEEVNSVGVVELHVKSAGGVCTNKKPLVGFKRCAGGCRSRTVYNKSTGAHDSECSCCRATQYVPLMVQLVCPNGRVIPHQISAPHACSCLPCGP